MIGKRQKEFFSELQQYTMLYFGFLLGHTKKICASYWVIVKTVPKIKGRLQS